MIKARNIDLDKTLSNKTVKRVFPSVDPKSATVTAKTADYTVIAAEFDSIFTNTGDTGAQVLTLPAATTVADKGLRVAVTAAYTITLTPASGEKIFLNGSGVASKYLLVAGVVGNFVEVYSDGTDYIVTNYSGVVTKEA